jgi:hypothetical protein
VELNQLSPEALAEVHANALEQEERAYRISKEVYDQTPPLELPVVAKTSGETSEATTTSEMPREPAEGKAPEATTTSEMPREPAEGKVPEATTTGEMPGEPTEGKAPEATTIGEMPGEPTEGKAPEATTTGEMTREPTEGKAPEATTTGEMTREPTEGKTPEAYSEGPQNLDPSGFEDPTKIDNEWLPLKPGNQWILEGKTVEDGKETLHQVLFTVTDLVKEIAQVPAVMTLIREYANGELEQARLGFFAQDNDGTVWYLGEYAEVYKDKQVADSATWIAGLEDAKAGIHIQAKPQIDTPSYARGWGPAAGWAKRGQVNSTGIQTCVPMGCYEDVLVIDEFKQGEREASQIEYYARGAGLVRLSRIGTDARKVDLGLASFSALGPRAQHKARNAALALEERAYALAEDVYGQTPPAERLQR